MIRQFVRPIFIAVMVVLIGGSLVLLAEGPSKPNTVPSNRSNEPNESPFAPQMLKIAEEYSMWGKLNNRSRWAPALCRGPSTLPQPPDAPQFSESGEKTPHGLKLYSLFVKDQQSYLKETSQEKISNEEASEHNKAPIKQSDQVVVKESWTIKPADDVKLDKDGNPPSEPDGANGNRFSHYAQRDGKWFKTDKKSALFIMYRVDPATPGTDDGWVYGTVSPDGNQVTSIGQVKSCMECHQQAPHGRLFGVDYHGK